MNPNSAQHFNSAVTSNPLPVIIDADMGPDDLMAILYLLKRPDIQIEGIIINGCGLALRDAGFQNAAGLLALAGAEDIPIALGQEEPLRGNNCFPMKWREAVREYPGVNLPKSTKEPQQNAVELIQRVVKTAPRKPVILALGPLTNIAETLQSYPQLTNQIEMIYIMGGALETYGNVLENRVSEFNLWIDPYAVNLVFKSGVPVTLVPLDATNQVPITPYFYEAIQQYHHTKEAAAVYDLLTGSPHLYRNGFYFWDAVTAAVTADNSLAEFENLRLRVSERDLEGNFCGQLLRAQEGTEVRVAKSVDAHRFEDEFLSTLNNGQKIQIQRTLQIDLNITYDGNQFKCNGPRHNTKRRMNIAVDNRSEVKLCLTVGVLKNSDNREDLSKQDQKALPTNWFDVISQEVFPANAQTTRILDFTLGEQFLLCQTSQPDQLRLITTMSVESKYI